jgi:hypothetical protein
MGGSSHAGELDGAALFRPADHEADDCDVEPDGHLSR